MRLNAALAPCVVRLNASALMKILPSSSTSRWSVQRAAHGRKPQRYRLVWLAALIGTLALGALVATGIVTEAPSADDQAALIEFQIIGRGDLGQAGLLDQAGQRESLTRIVQRVHAAVPRLEGLPNGQPREPRAVLQARSGVCFDRSRVIEQAARLAGFDVRRVFVLYGGWSQLLAAGGPTHTLVEVRTRQGWVALGTLTSMTGFANDGRVWSVQDLQSDALAGGKQLLANGWREIIPTNFLPLYGLYSRHGGQYPPYTPVPDFSPRQMLQAWWGDTSG